MKKFFIVMLCLLVAVFIVMEIANATLSDRGSGLFYDDDLDITWLDISTVPMSWDEAIDWADNLVYAGYSDWRLPLFNAHDLNIISASTACGRSNMHNAWRSDEFSVPDTSTSPSCIKCHQNYYGEPIPTHTDELSHLFYDELDGTIYNPISTSSDPDLALFDNLADVRYWYNYYVPDVSTDEYDSAMVFDFSNGVAFRETVGAFDYGGEHHDVNEYFVIAVRGGETVVPEPATMLLLCFGLIGLVGFKWKFKKQEESKHQILSRAGSKHKSTTPAHLP